MLSFYAVSLRVLILIHLLLRMTFLSDLILEAVLPQPVVSDCVLEWWVPPNDSTCWKWNKQGSSPSAQIGNQKGCDFTLYEIVVCECDPYYREVSWDLSCHGLEIEDMDLKNNYFVLCA